jgi:hypothetical protein
MPARPSGSAIGMEHHFTMPARVVELTDDGPQEVDPDTGELLPPAPAATDDGTPVNAAAGSERRHPDRRPA